MNVVGMFMRDESLHCTVNVVNVIVSVEPVLSNGFSCIFSVINTS